MMNDPASPFLRPAPAGGVGAGSQPAEDDGASLEYLAMPSEMRTYRPPLLPEPEDLAGCEAGLAMLRSLHVLLLGYRVGAEPQVFDLNALPVAARQLVQDSLGEGEVSICWQASDAGGDATRSAGATPFGPTRMDAQETRLAGVWRVRSEPRADGGYRRDVLEVADAPGFVHSRGFAEAKFAVELPEPLPDGVMNAPGVISELLEQVARRAARGSADDEQHEQRADIDARAEPHIINLSLLPQTEADLALLHQTLGAGALRILSRGYGNCRVTTTGLRDVWWVQYFNADDTLILNTLEVTDVPAAVLAAQDDIDDSAERLGEILDALVASPPADALGGALPRSVPAHDADGSREPSARPLLATTEPVSVEDVGADADRDEDLASAEGALRDRQSGKLMECRICWHVYDPALGDEARQIPPGVEFEALPEDWHCPRCDAPKDRFLARE